MSKPQPFEDRRREETILQAVVALEKRTISIDQYGTIFSLSRHQVLAQVAAGFLQAEHGPRGTVRIVSSPVLQRLQIDWCLE